ncbi:MAG: hypothetical protein K0R39_5122 [Symbiobacteriaceae bacterium]|jgi:hypothetical protein|nr:hypothetical protein [Symbiobacteriaceae bacterium]
MSDSRQPWYKSTMFIGAVLTLAGFGFFTLLYWLIAWLMGVR